MADVLGEAGAENDGGVGAREFVADNKDLGAPLFRLEAGTASAIEDGTDLGVLSLSEPVSDGDGLSRGFLPLSMSFSLSGSSSKSTKFFGASTCSVLTPETTRGFAVTLNVGDRMDCPFVGEADPDREWVSLGGRDLLFGLEGKAIATVFAVSTR